MIYVKFLTKKTWFKSRIWFKKIDYDQGIKISKWIIDLDQGITCQNLIWVKKILLKLDLSQETRNWFMSNFNLKKLDINQEFDIKNWLKSRKILIELDLSQEIAKF